MKDCSTPRQSLPSAAESRLRSGHFRYRLFVNAERSVTVPPFPAVGQSEGIVILLRDTIITFILSNVNKFCVKK